MTVKFTARIPTVEYGYIEVESDSFAEFTEALVSAQDTQGNFAAAQPDVMDQAITNLQNAGLVHVNPGLTTAGPRPDFVPQGTPMVPPPAQAQQFQQWAPQAQADGGPTTPPESCVHGVKKWIPAGVSKTTGKPYPAFWGCQAPQGQPKCR